MASIGLPIASYKLPSPQASSAQLLNCFAEQAPKDGKKAPIILRRCAGIRAWADSPAEGVAVRGFDVLDGVLYALIGTTLYTVSSTGVTSALSGTVPGGERVQMVNNGLDIVIVRPQVGTAYSYSGVSVAQITDPVFLGFGPVGNVVFIDGYFVFRVQNSGRFFNSGINALTFNALDVATAEGAPDDMIAMIVDHREIIMPGSFTTEIWYDAANDVGSPFSRSPDGLLEQGCAAGQTLGKQDNSVFWLANDLTMRRLASNNPTKISNYGIDSLVQRLPRADDGFTLSYVQDGHLMYAVTFPFAGRTVVFDCSTGEWHERDSLGFGRWRANCIAQAYGMQLIGDSETGRIGVLDLEVFEEWGEPQRAAWQYQGVYANRNRVVHRRFELAMNTGYGTLTGQGSNPLATLKISDDGGVTFRTLPTRSIGIRGNYTQRPVWWNLGSSRDRVYRMEITDPVPIFSTDTQLEAEGARL